MSATEVRPPCVYATPTALRMSREVAAGLVIEVEVQREITAGRLLKLRDDATSIVRGDGWIESVRPGRSRLHGSRRPVCEIVCVTARKDRR